MKRWAALVCALLLPFAAVAEGTFPGKVQRTYESPTLRYTIESFQWEGARCYLSRVWMENPGKQIRKATAVWEENIQLPSDMAKNVPGAALVINGSGYVNRMYPWIPENYPGTNSDYFNTPLGALTITDGKIFRNLSDVPYTGLTLQEDGLHLHVDEATEDVLKQSPLQTWSFYVECPLIRDDQSILAENWPFATRKAMRTIIGKVDDHNYILLTVTAKISGGLALTTCVDFLLQQFDLQWAYNLDGGPSVALLARNRDKKDLQTVYGNTSKDADVMAFVEMDQ